MPYKDPEKRKAYARKKNFLRYHRLVAENPNYRKGRADKIYNRRIELNEKIYSKLGNKCSNPACQWLNSEGTRGCTDRRCLQIDHVFGGGLKEDRNRGVTFLIKVLNDVEGKYQLLCANCNWIKRKINGEEHARIYKN